MKAPDQAAILSELDAALGEFQALRSSSKHEDCSDRPRQELERVYGRLVAAVERFAPEGSFYRTRTKEIREMIGLNSFQGIVYMPGVLRAFRDDLAADRVRSVTELVHADVFSDFLDMAQHLLDQRYKDAAAVIAGSSLEAHLRAMCALHNIATQDAGHRPKKADTLNAELDRAGAYTSKGDLKNVTAWLDLRNHAAHGDYKKYGDQQVGLLIASIRDFMTRYPA